MRTTVSTLPFHCVVHTAMLLSILPFAARAENAVGIGGRTSATASISAVHSEPDARGADSDTVLVSLLGAYTTQDARWEVGAGLQVLGLFTDIADFAVYSPTVQARVNSNALGPEENILLYLGAVAGLGVLRTDAPGIEDDEFGVFGPKAGAEIYFAPNMAVQIEDQFTWDTEGGTTNNLTVGFKLLFN